MNKSLAEHSLYHCLEKFPVYRLSISGGPCGGKTTLLNKIRDEFTKKGFKVVSLP
jgi:uridine kinase